MANSSKQDRLRLVFMERDKGGVLAIADEQFQYLGGTAGFEAMEEHLGDGDFVKLECDDGRECYLREGVEPPTYIRPHIKAPQI